MSFTGDENVHRVIMLPPHDRSSGIFVVLHLVGGLPTPGISLYGTL